MRKHVNVEEYRLSLIHLSYRITGSYSEAEDIVQETWVKWLQADQESIRSAKSWLFKVASRLSLDYLKSARVQRQHYIGPWLPEPFLLTQNKNDTIPELDESISMAFLVVLEKLNPLERLAFILYDIFKFSHGDICEVIDSSEENSRQLVSRARKKIKQGPQKYSPSPQQHAQITQAFLKAVKQGDMKDLNSLFVEDIHFHADGGGKATASPEILIGKETISSFLVTHVTEDLQRNDCAVKERWFNGAPGLIVIHQSQLVTAFHFDIREKKIQGIYALRNPDKLKLFKID